MGHVLTKTNQHVKYESTVKNRFQDNDRKQFGQQTDRKTDRNTGLPTLAKQYAPSYSKGAE